MLFLVNSPKKKAKKAKRGKRSSAKTRRRTKHKTKRQGEGFMARKRRRRNASGQFVRGGSRPKRRKRRATTRRSSRRRASSRRSTFVAKRPRRVYVQNPRPRRSSRRRSYRRNPMFSGIVGQVMEVGVATVTILASKAATNYVSNMVPYFNDSALQRALKKGAIGFGMSFLAAKFASKEVARNVFIGALLGPAEEGLRAIPGVGPMFSGYFQPSGTFPAVPPGTAAGEIAGYFQPRGMPTGMGAVRRRPAAAAPAMGGFEEFYSA